MFFEMKMEELTISTNPVESVVVLPSYIPSTHFKQHYWTIPIHIKNQGFILRPELYWSSQLSVNGVH